MAAPPSCWIRRYRQGPGGSVPQAARRTPGSSTAHLLLCPACLARRLPACLLARTAEAPCLHAAGGGRGRLAAGDGHRHGGAVRQQRGGLLRQIRILPPAQVSGAPCLRECVPSQSVCEVGQRCSAAGAGRAEEGHPPSPPLHTASLFPHRAGPCIATPYRQAVLPRDGAAHPAGQPGAARGAAQAPHPPRPLPLHRLLHPHLCEGLHLGCAACRAAAGQLPRVLAARLAGGRAAPAARC